MPRPTAAFLDVNDTLSDLASVEPAFVAAGFAAHDVRAWYLSVLRDGFALTVVGENPAFADLAMSRLRAMVALSAPGRDARSVDATAAALFDGFVAATPHADVVPGIVALADAGLRVHTLSNGSPDVARRLLAGTAAGVRMSGYLSATDGGAWKPAPASYRHGVRTAGVGPDEALMVAVHPWDLEGAGRAGLQTAWINRDGVGWPEAFTPPDIVVGSFVELAAEIDSHHS